MKSLPAPLIFVNSSALLSTGTHLLRLALGCGGLRRGFLGRVDLPPWPGIAFLAAAEGGEREQGQSRGESDPFHSASSRASIA
jgi:hypothetical protein